MSTFTVVSTVTHRSLMNKSKDNLARWVLHLLDCRDENERVRVQRVVDLLEANNSYQQIARDARAALNARFDLVAHLHRQREFSLKTFGPGARTAGVVDHIRKELIEIEADPTDVKEWIDVVILAFDGAWRAGFEPSEIVEAIVAKQTKNEKRRWPDWRTADPDKAIEHDRSGETVPPARGAWNVRELLDEGLEILNAIIDNVKRHGNYSPESTCVFIDQAGQCLREALSALEPAAPAPMTGEDIRRIFQPLPEAELAVLREVDPDTWDHPTAAPEGRQEAVAFMWPDAFERLRRGDSPRETAHAVTTVPNSIPLYTRPAQQAEPAAAYTVDYLGCEYISRDVESIRRVAARGDHGPTEVVYLYEHPAAVTETQEPRQ